MLIKEACIENYTNLEKVIARGANRIELCDNLSNGGTTVSHAVMLKALEYARPKNIPVMAMIRPRSGNFIYSNVEKEIILADIRFAKKLGIDGVVIGALNDEDWLDEEFLVQVLQVASDISVTFHMAFDAIKKGLQLKAIDWLSVNNVDRILTHGGDKNHNIFNNLSHIKSLITYAGSRITILPGGGITYQNLDFIVDELKIREVHGTNIVRI